MKRVVISVIAIIILLALYIFLLPSGADNDGEVTIIVSDGTTVYEEELAFEKGQTLFRVLDDAFDVTCANMNYKPSTEGCLTLYGGSPVILGLNDIMTDWTNTYFAIYLNDEYSVVGVSSIELSDGDVVRFEVEVVGGD